MSKAKPFVVPGGAKVRPMREEDFRMSHATLGEKTLFDVFANENTRLGGTVLDYYQLDLKATQVDPLYNESVNKVWRGPYKLSGYLQYPSHTTNMKEQGLRTEWKLECWISRKEFEDAGIRYPDRMDIVRAWDVPYFNDLSVNFDDTEKAGLFFSTVNVEDDGHLFDNPDFVGFKMQLRLNSEFNGIRHILPP